MRRHWPARTEDLHTMNRTDPVAETGEFARNAARRASNGR